METVAPHAGAWIETLSEAAGFTVPMSHPTQVRGLKLMRIVCLIESCGSPPSRVRD